MDLKDWVGPTISATAAGFSVLFSVITRFEVKRQQRLQSFGLRRQYDADLRAWANTALSAMSEGITLTYLSPTAIDAREFDMRREEIATRLTTFADAGRWFFPNEDPESHGQGKPTAYRGFRPAILDCVVGSFNDVRGLSLGNSNEELRESLENHRRHFVSHVQMRLDPRAREDELNKLFG